MQNPTNDNQHWWSVFHFEHGLDSMEERAFLGYLSTRHVDVTALSSEQLDTHWTNFVAWWETSLRST
jgi:hypothetical protein